MNKIITILMSGIGLILMGMLIYKINVDYVLSLFWMIFVNLVILLLLIVYIIQAISDIKEDWIV